ncbi:hypothetical protein [Brucella melitensis]|uniref:hypothetical protein n=1 Tax=Brucella melitensis TaxID=29459 RepID=UPI0002CEB246|nr:hypothetical protein [Brucella melitensis]ARY45613.1 hypothetical protein BK153_16380 [Brucella melitensis]ARY48777.1 hypothetical protein BK154_16385 [Brucella melitensis]ENQ95473.1 hypothetical protein C048_02947 [Brucella melitensis UK19/04]ENS55818.1 hypothetical protein C036_02263 [Brucella melitensis F1/06 B10]ENS68647.1 hypothetical protein C034_02670 [Brucella melitensis UK14/06]
MRYQSCRHWLQISASFQCYHGRLPISDATRGRVDATHREAMDRLSCNQEDIVGFLKRISSSDVKMFTLSEDEISPLHVGLKSRMNALILKDLADKTRRKQGGRDDAEKSCGGNSYGYAPRLGIDLLEDTARHRLRSAKFVSSRSDLQRLAHLSFWCRAQLDIPSQKREP